ncbi:hypothetical protein Acor_53770 [Acrocarpospora corrugata]|uniref:Uncharacterized protein n=1 Tax=Acrocarpospora corrugata TaxID=35763 RepID=A0A5M3W885_9ACTN|nr:hypothetical protein [Acrocarpospora corrugata]GES03311.1 hypothetical protein Acor_53770 [Acrocarpospora corrugata]
MEIRLFLAGIGAAVFLAGIFQTVVRIGDATTLEPTSLGIRLAMIGIGFLMMVGFAISWSRRPRIPRIYRLARLLISVVIGLFLTLVAGVVAFLVAFKLSQDTKITGEWSGDLVYKGQLTNEISMVIDPPMGDDARTGWLTIAHINGSCLYRLNEQPTGSHQFVMALRQAEPANCPRGRGPAHITSNGRGGLSVSISENDQGVAIGEVARREIMSP